MTKLVFLWTVISVYSFTENETNTSFQQNDNGFYSTEQMVSYDSGDFKDLNLSNRKTNPNRINKDLKLFWDSKIKK